MLIGAVDRMWELIGLPLFGAEALLTWSDQARRRSAREAPGRSAFDHARERGARITGVAAVAHALGHGDRPPRSRTGNPPKTGFPTRREYEVASLISVCKSTRRSRSTWSSPSGRRKPTWRTSSRSSDQVPEHASAPGWRSGTANGHHFVIEPAGVGAGAVVCPLSGETRGTSRRLPSTVADSPKSITDRAAFARLEWRM